MHVPAYQLFDGLNEFQERAVKTTDSPLLVVAGPGTGKTRTIVRRIAYLVHQGVPPEEILAVTFTNRAAREMRKRAAAVIGSDAAKIFIGTFHLLGLRIIRDNRAADFVIYSRDEQAELLKSLLKDSAKKVQQAVERISRIKNFLEEADNEIQETYEAYQAALAQRNALDFDDLISMPIEMLQNSETARTYQDRFPYIIVDEYQDINPAQYRLLRLIATGTGNVCAVGDADQAIYAFRGADIENFMNFEKDFSGAAWITLSENYRSSSIIVDAADNLIKHNLKRIDKELAPTREKGPRITVMSAPDERAEGAAIIQEIEQRMGGTSHYQQMHAGSGQGAPERPSRFSDFAVIFRTNAQAKALEEAFSVSGIPYQLIGRRSSAQAKETEETIKYLQSLIPSHGTAGPGPADATNAQETKLLTAADFFDPRADAVALMTMHMAKGLEFPIVFITGCEDGLIPCTVMKEGVDIEEERRLFYVGMTRAKDELYLIRARNRFLYGKRLALSPSPFLGEIPEKYIQASVVPDRTKKQKGKDNQLELF
jgi:superfamily I DNA/RNA helicase